MTSAKIVIAGGFGVGKTTLVGSISEIPPINTEAWMTAASKPVEPAGPRHRQEHDDRGDGLRPADHRRRSGALPLRYAGPGRGSGRCGTTCAAARSARWCWSTPAQLEVSFAAVNYFEQDSEVPFVVCVNLFDGVLQHDLDGCAAGAALPDPSD